MTSQRSGLGQCVQAENDLIGHSQTPDLRQYPGRKVLVLELDVQQHPGASARHLEHFNEFHDRVFTEIPGAEIGDGDGLILHSLEIGVMIADKDPFPAQTHIGLDQVRPRHDSPRESLEAVLHIDRRIAPMGDHPGPGGGAIAPWRPHCAAFFHWRWG